MPYCWTLYPRGSGFIRCFFRCDSTKWFSGQRNCID